MDTQRKILIIGSSIAGVTAAESARKQDPDALITILSRDSHLPYYRLRICEVLDDPAIADQLALHPPEWYADRRIDLLLGKEVRRVDRPRSMVVCTDSQEIPYTSLIIATGSASFVPPIPGVGRPGVHTLWTMSDALEVEQSLRRARQVLVIGGGLLGLEAAYHVRKKGLMTFVAEKMPRLLANQLDEEGSSFFLTRVQNLDVKVVTSADIIAIEGTGPEPDAPAAAAVLADGSRLDADLILVCIGVRAQVSLAQEAGLKISRRIVTDESMRTSDESIFAAGDAAEPLDYWFGLWSVSKAQGLVAGTNAAGGNARFDRTVPPYLLNTMETKVAVLGDKGQLAEPSYELDVLLDEDSGNYRKLIYREGIFRGFILIGDIKEYVRLQKAIGDQKP